MRSETEPNGQDERSFIENARRAQIIECAIDTIAELGYAKASLSEIAKRAGISKGVISYHFAGKRELIAQVLATIRDTAVAEMRPRVMAEKSAARMLRVYIESNFDYLGAHHNQLLALLTIGTSSSENGSSADRNVSETLAPIVVPALVELENLLRYGQKRGEFREFSTRVVAIAIRQAIDGFVWLLSVEPNLDLKASADELATLFDFATRKQ